MLNEGGTGDMKMKPDVRRESSTKVFCLGRSDPGFVLLLEVLEKPWNLTLDFKGA